MSNNLLNVFSQIYHATLIGMGIENVSVELVISQPAFTCSMLTIETLEQGVKYVLVNNKDTRMTPLASFWFLYC